MNPRQLIDATPASPTSFMLFDPPIPGRHILPARASGDFVAHGNELRSSYCDLAKGFRRILQIAPSSIRTPDGGGCSAPINLGRFEHSRYGTLLCGATVQLEEYNPANEHTSGFNAKTYFFGKTEDGRNVALTQEYFGQNRYDSGQSFAVPAFIRNPSNTCADPWDRRIVSGLLRPLNSRWTANTYKRIRDRLEPMLAEAAETQTMIAEALKDPARNAEFAARALHLTIADIPSATR